MTSQERRRVEAVFNQLKGTTSGDKDVLVAEGWVNKTTKVSLFQKYKDYELGYFAKADYEVEVGAKSTLFNGTRDEALDEVRKHGHIVVTYG